MGKKRDIVNSSSKIVPDIKYLELDIAGDILDENNIKYEIQSKKIVTLFVDKNCVAKTEPKIGKNIGDNEVLKVYPSAIKLYPFFIIFFVILFMFFYINNNSVTPILGGSPTIEADSNEYVSSNTVYVSNDASFNFSDIDYYKYCIDTKFDSCNWIKTDYKSTNVSLSGNWFVWFKAVNKNGDESYTSNRLRINIDNEGPDIKSIKYSNTKKSIDVNVDAIDELSGIDKYYYSIDNSEYISSNKSYIFSGLEDDKEYNINVKVIDKVGNETLVSFKAKTGIKTITTSKKSENNIPLMSINNVPSFIYLNDEYNLPTDTKYALNDSICYVDDKIVKNTKELSLGENKVKCVASSSSGFTLTKYKNINVISNNKDDEVIDNKSYININYPSDASKYMYRFYSENTRLKNNIWKYYSNSLYIDTSDISNIMIKYNKDGKENIIMPNNKLVVDIRPDKYVVNSGEEININIIYDDNSDEKLYRINNSNWIKYESSFKVNGNTKIEAKSIRHEKVYDEKLNKIVNKDNVSYDSIYIINNYVNSTNEMNISLDYVPLNISKGSIYSLPSYYSFGNHGSYIVKCQSDGIIYDNTSKLSTGSHDLTCMINALDGEVKIVNKTINVTSNDDIDNNYISLDLIPSTIKLGESYKVPSYSNNDNYKCNIDNTNKLKVGKYNIICNSLNNTISKEINIVKDNSLSIDFNNIPDTINIGDSYMLPSHFYSNNYIKNIKCINNNKIINNTNELDIGNNIIECSITSDDKIKKASIEINVLNNK